MFRLTRAAKSSAAPSLLSTVTLSTITLSTITLCVGCQRPLTQAECHELLDRYVELLVRSDRPGTTKERVLELKLEAREKARQSAEFQTCPERVARAAYECALKANTADQIERCLL
jgi:hypothetical protein